MKTHLPTISPELKSVLKKLKLGPILATLPERIVLAEKQHPKILVVGAINVDVTAHVCGALDATTASTVVGSDEPPSFTQGGRGYNQAVACARLGIATHLVAMIGNDLLARRVIEDVFEEVTQRMPLDVTSVLRAKEKEAKLKVLISNPYCDMVPPRLRT